MTSFNPNYLPMVDPISKYHTPLLGSRMSAYELEKDSDIRSIFRAVKFFTCYSLLKRFLKHGSLRIFNLDKLLPENLHFKNDAHIALVDLFILPWADFPTLSLILSPRVKFLQFWFLKWWIQKGDQRKKQWEIVESTFEMLIPRVSPWMSSYFSTTSPIQIFNVILVSSWSPTINGPFGLTSISF